MIMISINFIFSFTNFCVIVSFLTKLLILGILFSTAVRAVVVYKLVIQGIASSILLVLPLYTSFLATSFFTALLSLLKSTETGSNLSISNLSNLSIAFVA